MTDLYNPINTFNYTRQNSMYWPLGTTLIDSAITSNMTPKVEENPEELKINIKKHQIKFNFVL